jgi:hypothetical protein
MLASAINTRKPMNDITKEEMTQVITDETLKAWWEGVELPEECTVNEFFVKCLEACSVAAAQKNETREAGQKILGYPSATNGAIARTKTNQLYFPRTSTVSSLVVVDLDVVIPAVG